MRKITLLMAVLGLMFSSTAQNIPDYLPTDSLVGYWGFDGDANDYSGNSNNGTVNGATLTEDRYGNDNSAYSFDGVDDYIDLGYGLYEESFSISLWLSVDSLINYQNQIGGRILSAFTNGESFPNNFEIGLRKDLAYLGCGNGTTQGVNNNEHEELNLKTWYNVIVVYHSNIDSLALYINSDKISEGEMTMNNTFNKVILGARANDPPSFFYSGKIDDIAIYNRALSEEEIQGIYNEQAPSGLIAHYPFTGSAVDISGNENHGTVNGATLTEDRFGNMNSAYEFDGVDDWIEISGGVINPSSSGSFVISNWFKIDTIDIGNNRHLWYLGDGVSGYTVVLNFDSTLGFSNTSGSHNILFYSDKKVETDVWHHLVLLIDQVNGVTQMILDNDIIAYDSVTVPIIPDSSDLKIGSHLTVNSNAAGSVVFDGSIDDIRIFSKLLNSDEIGSLYSSGQCFETIEVFDTTVVMDTTEVVIEVMDTTEVLDTSVVMDTMLTEVYDTTEVIIDVLDTMIVMDTTVTEFFDTISVMDTTVTEVFDTISVMDTNVVTVYDTMLVMDTSLVTVHDTLVITMSSDTAAGIDFLTTEVNVYPNPASTQLNVEIDMSGDYTVSLTNINGQMVFTQANVVDDLQIDISDFTKGLYFITIRDNDEVLKAEERKIVIE